MKIEEALKEIRTWQDKTMTLSFEVLLVTYLLVQTALNAWFFYKFHKTDGHLLNNAESVRAWSIAIKSQSEGLKDMLSRARVKQNKKARLSKF